MLLLYSTGGIFSKYAAGQEFFSASFLLFYGELIAVLGLYAIGWQQILRWIPLSVAFAHKSVCVVWSLVWGILFFHESLTIGKAIGVLLIMAGMILFTKSEES